MSFNPQRTYNTFQLPTPQFKMVRNGFGGMTIIEPKFKLTPSGGLAIVRPDNSNRIFSGVESFASYSFNIASNRLNSPTHPVTWYNVTTKQPALTLNMLSDTGADYSTIDSKNASKLGIDDLKKGLQASVTGTGGQVENTFYIHRIPFKIGNLKPVTGSVALGRGAGTDVLGRTFGLNWFSITYTNKTVKYTELAQTQSAYSQARWRGRI